MKDHATLKKGLSLILALMLILTLAVPRINAQAASKKVKISASKATMEVGETKAVSLKKGSKKITKKVKWKSSNKKVATVSSKGKIKAKKKGKATITATYKGKKYKCKITVKAKGSSSKVNPTSAPNQPTASPAPTATPTPTPTPKVDPLTLSESKVSMNIGQRKVINVLNNGADYIGLSSSVKWSSSNEDVVSVDNAIVKSTKTPHGRLLAEGNGTATITAKITTSSGTKELSCEVTVTGESFDVSKDLEVETSSEEIFIKFTLKKGEFKSQDEYEKEIIELLDQGCTIGDLKLVNGKIQGTVSDVMEVTKNQVCETAKYKFKKLPKTLADIKNLMTYEEKNWKGSTKKAGADPVYGGFTAMAANICVANAMADDISCGDAHGIDHPAWAMFEYINGSTYTINQTNWTTAYDSVTQALAQSGNNAYKCFFEGATPANNYTPTASGDYKYVINMYRGPYFINSKTTINGYRPTTYMILVPGKDSNSKLPHLEGFDTDRYIDVYRDANGWWSFENNFMHVTANGIKKPSTTIDPYED